MIKLLNFNNYELSGITYGGHGGSKKGIIIDNEKWFLKYPKTTKSMKNVNLSYTTTPISEYLGSCIYESIGIDTHKTKLGIANNKIVVACKDFLNDNEIIFDYNSIKNNYDENIEQIFISSSIKSDNDIEEVMISLDKNAYFKLIPEIKNRFWDMFVVDALISNNDRNDGNWGFIYDRKTKKLRIAPVFDNGACFNNKLNDERIFAILNDENRFIQNVYHSATSIFKENGKIINPLKYIESMKNKDCNDALIRIFKRIDLDKINEIFNEIPLEYNGISVLSEAQRKLHLKILIYRYEMVFLPIYNKLVGSNN